MAKKSLAGWVFRLEVITDNPAIKTSEMMARIKGVLSHMENVETVEIEELYEFPRSFVEKRKQKEAS